MSLLELLMDQFLMENICRPTLADVLAPEVASWVEKNMKLHMSDLCYFTETKLRSAIRMSSHWPSFVGWPMGTIGCWESSCKQHI